MRGEIASVTYETVLTDGQLCLLSRKIANFVPHKPGHEGLVCLSTNRPTYVGELVGAPVEKLNGFKLYRPHQLHLLTWTSIHAGDRLGVEPLPEKGQWRVSYAGKGVVETTNYLGYLLYLKPELSPVQAVTLRILAGISKTVKNPKGRKRHRLRVSDLIRVSQTAGELLGRLDAGLRDELTYVPQDVLMAGLGGLLQKARKPEAA